MLFKPVKLLFIFGMQIKIKKKFFLLNISIYK